MKHLPLFTISFLLALLLPVWLGAQPADTLGVDTTSRGYRIGYAVGSWLPFLVLFTLALLVLLRSIRLSRDKKI